MLFMSFWLWKNTDTFQKTSIVKFAIISIFGFITFVVNAIELKSLNETQAHRLIGKTLKNTFLDQYVTHKNSEMALLIFSPKCPHCISVAKSLSKSKIGVIGIYPDVIDSKTVAEFVEEVKPTFQIYPVKTDSLMKYTVEFPTIFIIENSTVKKVLNNYQSQ